MSGKGFGTAIRHPNFLGVHPGSLRNATYEFTFAGRHSLFCVPPRLFSLLIFLLRETAWIREFTRLEIMSKNQTLMTACFVGPLKKNDE